MDTTHCINNKTWELYAAKKLPEVELVALQKHMDNCELCSDVKEGIDAMPMPELLGKQVQELNKQVDEYLQPKKTKRIPIWYWSAAAVLLISLGIGFIYTKNNTSDVALVTPENKTKPTAIDTIENKGVTPKKEEITTPPLTKTTTEDDKEEEAITKQEAKSSEGSVGIGGTKKESSNTYKNGELEKEDLNLDVEDFSQKGRLYVDTVSTSRESIQPTQGNKDLSRKEKRKKLALPSPQMNNMFNNNNLNNNLGLNNFDFKQPLDSLNYNTALKAFENDSLEKSLSSLSYIVLDPNSKLYEEGLLLKAKVLIKQGKKDEAEAVLNKVIALKGKRKRKAKRLLRKLK